MNALDILCPICGAKAGWKCHPAPGHPAQQTPHWLRSADAAAIARTIKETHALPEQASLNGPSVPPGRRSRWDFGRWRSSQVRPALTRPSSGVVTGR